MKRSPCPWDHPGDDHEPDVHALRNLGQPSRSRHAVQQMTMSPGDASTGSAMGQLPVLGVTCAVCQHEVPLSEAVVPEATDYLIFLCGLDCYQQWRASGTDGS